MYVPVDISNFGHEKLFETEKVDRFYFEAFLHNTLVRRAFDLCLEGLSWECHDQQRSTYLSPETPDAITIVNFSQPLVPIAVNWKMANIAAVAGSFDS